MQSTYSILFYPKGGNKDRHGNVPIYMRITVNGKRSELNIKRKIGINKWNPNAGKMKGTTADVREFNRYLTMLKDKANKIYEALTKDNDIVTSEMIKNIYLGKKGSNRMLLEIFSNHNKKV